MRGFVCLVSLGAVLTAAGVADWLIQKPKIMPIPVVRISSAIALEMCNHIEFVVVTKSNGDATLLLDPAREAIELLDKTIGDPKRKQVIHMQCPHPSNTI